MRWWLGLETEYLDSYVWFTAVGAAFTSMLSKCGYMPRSIFFFLRLSHTKAHFDVHCVQARICIQMRTFMSGLHSFLSHCASVEQSVGLVLTQRQVERGKGGGVEEKKEKRIEDGEVERTACERRRKENEQWKCKSLNQKNKKFIERERETR